MATVKDRHRPSRIVPDRHNLAGADERSRSSRSRQREDGAASGRACHRDSALNVAAGLMVVTPSEHPVQDVLDLAKVVRDASYMLYGPSLRLRSLMS